MNIQEFGALFLKPLFFLLISGLILAAIALVRLDVRNRRSITWYVLFVAVSFLKRNDFEKTRRGTYSEYTMSPMGFAVWQVTKIILLAPLFANAAFGMVIQAASQGAELHLDALVPIFSLPFADVQDGSDLGRSLVVPAMLPLTMILPLVFSALGVRLLIYLGLGGALDLFTRYLVDSSQGKPRYLGYISKIELIAGVTFLWIMFNLVFSTNLDASSRFVITAFLALGIAFISFGLLDTRRSRVIIYPDRRQLYARFVTAVAITAVAGIIVVVNDSFLGANSSTLRVPYAAQQISVNRYLAELDGVNQVSIHPNVTQPSYPMLTAANGSLASTVGKVILWDKEAALSRLKEPLSQRADLAVIDSELIRNNNSLFWAGVTTPVRPSESNLPNKWYSDHIALTHSDAGIPIISATLANGTGSESPEQLSPQKEVYFGPSGDSGIFSRAWSAYPIAQSAGPAADSVQYNPNGGVDLSPPLTWIFDPNFLLSYPGQTVHITRYKDIFQRMDTLFPYFIYEFQIGDTLSSQFRKIDVTPVTDGSKSYWLVPLIMPIDTSRVPWASSFALRLIGYGVIDAYSGSIKIYVTGNDEYSNVFYETYKDTGIVEQSMPAWLSKQLRYPPEMFIWRMGKFDTFHVTNPQDFVDSKQFYDIPKETGGIEQPSYYYMDLSGGQNSTKYVGVQLVQSRSAPTSGVVGYATVSSDLSSLGTLTFYSDSNSTSLSNSTLISPDSARQMLGKDKDFQLFKSQLPGSPKVGDATLYKSENLYAYVLPIYTSDSQAGAAEQLAGVAIVSAPTSQFANIVGIGQTLDDALRNFLNKSAPSSAATPSMPIPASNNESAVQARLLLVEHLFAADNVTLVKPTAIVSPAQFQEARVTLDVGSTQELEHLNSTVSSFISEFGSKRVYEWKTSDTVVNFGVITEIQGVSEIHYVTVILAR
ncbi:MAG: UPF0182 family protein [Nitrososphaera sp.]|jgi:hypothetical protein